MNKSYSWSYFWGNLFYPKVDLCSLEYVVWLQACWIHSSIFLAQEVWKKPNWTRRSLFTIYFRNFSTEALLCLYVDRDQSAKNSTTLYVTFSGVRHKNKQFIIELFCKNKINVLTMKRRGRVWQRVRERKPLIVDVIREKLHPVIKWAGKSAYVSPHLEPKNEDVTWYHGFG